MVYCKSVRFSSFRHSRIHSKFYEVASFTENKARKHLREAGEFRPPGATYMKLRGDVWSSVLVSRSSMNSLVRMNVEGVTD